jgi:hypothetical protein
MKWVATVLGTILVVLTPLANASPVDPTWVAGLWDNGDFDDVIVFLTSDLHLLDSPEPPAVGVFHRLPDLVAEHRPGTPTVRVYEPGAPRAPPLA